MFDKVSEPVSVTKLSLCNALLNSATEPVIVLFAKSIDLFVSVSVVALPTSVSLALDGNVSVISAVGLPGVNVVSKLSLVLPSNTKLPVIVPLKAIVSVAAPPRLNVPPLNDNVPVTVKLPANVALEPLNVNAVVALELDLITNSQMSL